MVERENIWVKLLGINVTEISRDEIMKDIIVYLMTLIFILNERGKCCRALRKGVP